MNKLGKGKIIGLIALGVFAIGGVAYGVSYHTGANVKIENAVESTFKGIEDGVVSGAHKIEDAFVNGAK